MKEYSLVTFVLNWIQASKIKLGETRSLLHLQAVTTAWTSDTDREHCSRARPSFVIWLVIWIYIKTGVREQPSTYTCHPKGLIFTPGGYVHQSGLVLWLVFHVAVKAFFCGLWSTIIAFDFFFFLDISFCLVKLEDLLMHFNTWKDCNVLSTLRSPDNSS